MKQVTKKQTTSKKIKVKQRGLEKPKFVIIENVQPQIDCGRFPAKGVVGDIIKVTADIFAHGHDHLKSRLLWRKSSEAEWKVVEMKELGNDRWEGTFVLEEQGKYDFTVQAKVDHLGTWQSDLLKKAEAGVNIETDLKIGAELLEQMSNQNGSSNGKNLEKWITVFKQGSLSNAELEKISESDVFADAETEATWVDAETYGKILTVEVDRRKAIFSTWYELFPRSASQEPHKHGTFSDVKKLLPLIAEWGFDVLYLPPIHTIGRTKRKGKNNSLTALPNDPGSPWAIGAEEGGHKSIHPELGTLDDFVDLVENAKGYGIEIALDIAFQCSQDHPYIKEHPEWFKWRPDGTIQFAENPPKKYEDIVPINFETDDWQNLWNELKSVIEFWVDKGVKIFRVDNPHTKPFPFWEWVISEVRKKDQDVLFLAEAFTRPRVMERLAKLGFSQSYTYYTWRITKEELTEYIEQLSKPPLRDFFRPNFWPNTPDILTPQFWKGEESVFLTRLAMAATLSSNYGLYGPVYEMKLHQQRGEKEELIDSEKYEIRHWDWNAQTKIRDVIKKVNRIRKENPALQTTWFVNVAKTDNPQLFSYAKTDQHGNNPLLIVVNLDEDHVQSGWVKVPLEELKIPANGNYTVTDLMTGENYEWKKEWNYVELHPEKLPFHIFKISFFKEENATAATAEL